MSFITSVLGSTWRFAKNNRWKAVIAAVIVLPIIGITFAALSPGRPEYVTAVAQRGDLRQTVEAVGTVISDRDLNLQFPTSGIVAQVYVKEGDVVRQGQRIAALRAGNLAADVASASARVQQAEADYQAKLEGSRPEDIAISEAEVANRRSSLDSAKTSLRNAETSLEFLRRETETSLGGYVSNAGSTASREQTTTLNSMASMRDILANNDVIDAIIRYGSSEYDQLTSMIRSVDATMSALQTSAAPSDFEGALTMLQQTRSGVGSGFAAANSAFLLIDRLPVTSYFDERDRETHKTTLASLRSALQASLNAIDAEIKMLRDASASYSTQISSQEGAVQKSLSDIATFEASLRIAEAQLQLKKAPPRKTDLDAAMANVRQARAALQRAQADYGNTVLTAPIAGRITKVNVKLGEFTPADSAVTMLGNSPYRIEMYVSEVDIPKLHLTQSGSVRLDAFRGTDFALRVSEIDSASTNRDGVPKYRVRLDFVYPHEELKIGMTGDAEIVTGTATNVVSVPLRAVLEDDNGLQYVRVQLKDNMIEKRSVMTGMEGESATIEVSNVEEGETVIVLEKL